MTISEMNTSRVASASSRSRIVCARGSSKPSSAAAAQRFTAASGPKPTGVLLGGPHGCGRRLCSCEPFCQVLLHDAHPLEIAERVEPKASGRAYGIEQAVPPLPGPK